jgi:hypothetical protein
MSAVVAELRRHESSTGEEVATQMQGAMDAKRAMAISRLTDMANLKIHI